MPTTEHAALYAALCAPFDVVHQRQQAGQNLHYISGEQVVSRLNEVLGVFGWSFETVETVRGGQADVIMCRGRLSVFGEDGRVIVREQWGSQEIKRRRDNAEAVNLGDDYKAAATDALKKSASLLGVGLYLLARDAPAPPPARPAPAPRSASGGAPPVTGTALSGSHPPAVTPPGPTCEECSRELRTYRTPAGKTLAPAELATETMAVLGRVLCSACASRAVAK